MSWFFRPSTFFFFSVALMLSALALVLWPGTPENRAIAQAVAEGDQEVAWLYAATNAAAWERFVAAVGTSVRRLQAEHPGLEVQIHDANAFPRQTTAVPELGLGVGGKSGRLWFRWYKLTSDLKTEEWVRALLARRPAPLAVLGGSSSDLAISLARSLHVETDRQALAAAAPLLFLTAATADEASPEQGPLNHIYAGRTFRFCFSNRQMAEAVIHFIWSQDGSKDRDSRLRPDEDPDYPFYLPWWEDDPYSRDLNDRFGQALSYPVARTTAESLARDWTWLAGFAALGGSPLHGANLSRARGPLGHGIPFSLSILYSIGTFDRPNRWEMDVARKLIDTKLLQYPDQRYPLLLLPAASQPARRFLRALMRIAPVEARHFVVATGDGVSFNLVYRDRNVAWPIQDLPFRLVFFCHRDPVDAEAGFVPANDAPAAEGEGGHSRAAGTEDLLLFADIGEALLESCYDGDRLLASPEVLGRKLHQARWQKGRGRVTSDPDRPLLFDADGNRRSGTGEHIVCLRPLLKGREVLPRSTIEVWSWQPGRGPPGRWVKRKELDVAYEGAVPQGAESQEP